MSDTNGSTLGGSTPQEAGGGSSAGGAEGGATAQPAVAGAGVLRRIVALGTLVHDHLSVAGGGVIDYLRTQWATDHLAAANPHPAYATDADLSAHAAAADPHPGYATDADLTAHGAAADPHPGYLTAAEGDSLFLTPAEGDAAYATTGHTHPSEESGPWRFQDTVGGAPGSGYLRTNTGALATATQLLISRTTQDGYDIPPPGWGLQADDTIYVQDRDDSTKWVRYRALEPLVRYPTYATGLVAVTGSAGSTIVNGQIVQVTFSLAGGGGGGGGGGLATDALWDAKGDLAAGTGADAAARLAAGTNGQLLSADSAQATGLAWVANPGTAHAALPDAHHARAHDHTAADGSGALSNEEHDGYSQYANLGADPATPGTNLIRLYAKDNGAGVATLYYRTEDGTIYELPTLTSGGGGGSGAPANATFITTAAESKLSAERVLGTAVIMSGTLAARPAFGTAGRLYLATDTDLVYRDTGSAWETFATRASSAGGLPTTGGTMTGTINAQGSAVDSGGALTVTSPAVVGSDIVAYGSGSPAWAPIGGGGTTDEQGLAFSVSGGGFLVAVRWYCRTAGQAVPGSARLWDSTSTAAAVWSVTNPPEWTNTTAGWKEHRLAAGTEPALVAGRTYAIAYGGGSPGASTSQASYVPVPDAGMTFVEHRQNNNAGVYPATVVTTAWGIDPVVRSSIASAAPAESGAIRLPNGDAGAIAWRNAADSGDLALTVTAADELAFDGEPLGGRMADPTTTKGDLIVRATGAYALKRLNPGLSGTRTDTGLTFGATFSSSVDGYITELRFYRTSLSTTHHGITLWSRATSTQVAGSTTSADWAGYGAVGWATYALPTPLAVTAGTQYTLTATYTGQWTQTSGSGTVDSPLTFVGAHYAVGSSSTPQYPGTLLGTGAANQGLGVDVGFTTSLTSVAPPTRLAVGTDGQALVADSTQTAGVKWGGAGALAGTSTTSAAGGSATALPSQPVEYVTITVNGASRKIACYS